MGLVSRAGVVPLNLAADIAGVVTRTVADTAAVLQVIAGSDPDDPVTVVARPFQGRDGGGPERPASQPKYADSLRRDGLKGARLGVLHQAYDTPMLDAEIKELFSGAIGELRDLGAEVIDPAAVAGFDDMRRAQTGGCNQFKHDLNQYLGALGGKAPSRSLDEIIKSRQFHPSIQGRLEAGQAAEDDPASSAGCNSRDEFRATLRAGVVKVIDESANSTRRAATTTSCSRRAPASLRSRCRWAIPAAARSTPTRTLRALGTPGCRRASSSSAAREASRRCSVSLTRTNRQRTTVDRP